MFERDQEYFDRIDTDNDVPQYLLVNKDRFGYTINRDPPSGNFEDFLKEDLIDSMDSMDS